jgi:hypothetical protein
MSNRTALAQARANLAAIEEELAALLAAKSEASKSTATFLKWRTGHDAATAERERLMTVIENLEPAVAPEESASAREDLLKRYEAKVTANAKLANRIRSDVAKANAILLALVRDVAKAAEEDSRINASLGDDLEPLVPADFIARGRPGLNRQEVNRTRFWLWTTPNGTIIGDQDSVVDLGNGLGKTGEGAYYTRCVAALFDQTEYYPSEPMERPVPLWQLRVPRPDGPGFEFDGSKCNYPADVLGELAKGMRAKEPRARPVEIELRPVPSIKNGAAA